MTFLYDPGGSSHKAPMCSFNSDDELTHFSKEQGSISQTRL